MTLSVKICGIKTETALKAVIEGGAGFAGFVFFPPSPRAINAEEASRLMLSVPSSTKKVGLFVNPTDEDLDNVCSKTSLDIIQLHGDEPAGRVLHIRERMKLPVMKAIRIAKAEDLEQTDTYSHVSDWLLLDAKTDFYLPGGSGKSFDWSLLSGRQFTCPWMLAGGINAGNLKDAITETGARIIDISSGVEDSPGNKNPEKIRELLALAATI